MLLLERNMKTVQSQEVTKQGFSRVIFYYLVTISHSKSRLLNCHTNRDPPKGEDQSQHHMWNVKLTVLMKKTKCVILVHQLQMASA